MATTNLTIGDLGPQGDGVHESPRGRVYVERALPGDLVRARVERDEDGIARGEIIEIVESSPYRQIAPCPHYERCGGCTLQHLQPAFYRDWKEAMVVDALRRQGLRPRQWLETVFVGERSRRRATFATLKLRTGTVMGYYRRRSRLIGDIDSCLVASPELMALRDLLKPRLGAILTEGKAVDVFLQLSGGAADMVVTGPVGRAGKADAAVKDAVARLMEGSPVARVSWRASERDPIQILGATGAVKAKFGRLEVALPPAAFLQPTPEGEAALVASVLEALPDGAKLADLFSGCGTFTGPMLGKGTVDAYESTPAAVGALSKAARGEALRVFRRDLFRNPLRRDELNRYDAIVFDPPRAGAAEQAVAMAAAKARTLVAVSCNPATFARDARLLCEGGYWLQSVRIVDQFVWSHHVEVVGVFTKRKRGR